MPTYDQVFLAVTSDGRVRQAPEAYPPEGSVLVRGLPKLGQRWVLEFLTERGSMPYRPDRGTPFLAWLRSGRVATEADAFAAFGACAALAAQNLDAEDRPDDPDDERLGSAILSKLVLAPGRLTLEVAITSRDGESGEVTLTV